MKPETETFTAYITKYAIAKGIITKQVERTLYPNMVSAGNGEYYHGKDWHLTMDAAVERAEDMRKKKIESLKKQIAKLEKMKF